jgi:hypothetical protein
MVARDGYRSNNVTGDEWNAICKLFEALGLQPV